MSKGQSYGVLSVKSVTVVTMCRNQNVFHLASIVVNKILENE